MRKFKGQTARSKVLERIIYNKCVDFLTSQLSTSQFGFMKNRSSLQQLLVCYKDVYESFSANQQSDVIFMDFAKAFDSVPHNELLLKLGKMGVVGDLWKWFKAYLNDRNQCVKIDDKRSSLLPVISGVPQGSILGPLLFIVYINDLTTVTHYSNMFIFADDTKCEKKIFDIQDCLDLQDDLNDIGEWSKIWKLLFKCALVRMSSSEPKIKHTYLINDKKISESNKYKDPGVTISSDLSWREHHEKIISRAYRSLGLLRRTFNNINSVFEKKSLYISLVRSQLLYASPLWRPQLLGDIYKLERVQKRATKFILNDFDSDYRTRLLSLDMLPLMYHFELQDVMFCVKSIQTSSTHFNIMDYISFNRNCTRSGNKNKMVHSRSRTNCNRHFYFNRLPRLWNALPLINLDSSAVSIRNMIIKFLQSRFKSVFSSSNLCSYHFVCPCSKCSSVPLSPNF